MVLTSVESCNKFFNGTGDPDFPDVNPNPDISGVGVLIGFLTTAYLTLTLVIVYYLMGYIEDDYMNEIDGWVINRFSPSKYFKSWPRLETTLRRVVLAFSDQQAVTGIALLGSGYGSLNTGIDSYHWQILVYLVWFSSLTHLTTLTVLRRHFLHNPAARLGRAVLMFITVAMLAVALLPTGDTLWSFGDDGSYQQSQGVPALCYFRRLGSHEHQKQFDVYSPGFISMIISIFILASGYLTRAVKLSNRASNITKAWFNEKPSHSLLHLRDCALERLERPVPTSRKIQWVVGYILIETFNVWFKVLYDIYASMLWEIIWLVSALAWGTRNLFAVRVANNIDAESSWGFGQIFTVILLVLPLLGTVETFYEKQLYSRLEQHAEDGSLSATTPRRNSRILDKKSPVILVGQWQQRQKPPTTEDSFPLGNLQTPTRTGTDLHNEEQSMGILRSRTLQQLDHAETSHSGRHPARKEAIGSNSSSEYYQFQWFWIILVTVLFMAVVAIIIALAVRKLIILFSLVPLAVGWILVPSFWYTAAFVTLSKFHAPLGTWIETHLGITRQKQKAILRFLTWCWPVITLTAMIVTELAINLMIKIS